MCDESGHSKFPFSFPAHVTLIAPARARAQSLLSPCSVPTQSLLGLAHLCSPLLPFLAGCGAVCQITLTLAEGPRTSPIYKDGQNVSHFKSNNLIYSYYLPEHERYLFSKSHAYTLYKHSCYLTLNLLTYLDKTL